MVGEVSALLLNMHIPNSPSRELQGTPSECMQSVGVLDEKASASQVLGSYAENTGALYGPHIEETLNMLLKMGNYFHCQVREQAYIALPLLYTATSQAFPAQPSGLPCQPQCLCGSVFSLCCFCCSQGM